MATEFVLAIFLGVGRLGDCVSGERWTDGFWTTVRLQHSRDEFPFVVLLFLLLLFNPFSHYYFGHVDDDTKMVGMGFPWLVLQYLLLFLTRRDDILVLKDIHYITGWVFRLPLGHRLSLGFKFVLVACL